MPCFLFIFPLWDEIFYVFVNSLSLSLLLSTSPPSHFSLWVEWAVCKYNRRSIIEWRWFSVNNSRKVFFSFQLCLLLFNWFLLSHVYNFSRVSLCELKNFHIPSFFLSSRFIGVGSCFKHLYQRIENHPISTCHNYPFFIFTFSSSLFLSYKLEFLFSLLWFPNSLVNF